MNGLMIRADAATQGDVAASDARARMGELLDAFLARRSAATRSAYEADLEDFARHVGAENAQAAIWMLICDGQGRANSLALQYKGSLVAASKAAATTNRRLSSLRSAVALARTLGIVAWALEVPNEKARSYRDTRGCGTVGVRAILGAIKGDGPKAVRDRAIVRLMYDCALRRGEIVTLRLEDADIEGKRLWIIGKGRNGEREAVTLPPPTVDALAAWIAARGTASGLLFTNYHHDGRIQGGGITGSGLYYLIRTLGNKAHVRTRPHGLRHTAVTEALTRTGGDVVMVQKYSRHRDLATVVRYNDCREDVAGEVAVMVAAAL